MSKFFKLTVTRSSSTVLYVKMPDNTTPQQMMNYKNVDIAARETTNEHDWDDYEWEKTVEVQSVKEVSQQEAEQYEVYEDKRNEI